MPGLQARLRLALLAERKRGLAKVPEEVVEPREERVEPQQAEHAEDGPKPGKKKRKKRKAPGIWNQ